MLSRYRPPSIMLLAIIFLALGATLPHLTAGAVLVTQVSPKKLFKGRKCGAFDLIIDVRTASEWNSGHIDGATLIENLAIKDVSKVAELENCKNCRIVLYCRSGARAGAAASNLVRAGFTNVANAGGIRDWTSNGYPLAKSDSIPTNCPTDTCPVKSSRSGTCPITLSKLKKIVQKTGDAELIGLIPSKNTETPEYCTLMRSLRRRLSEKFDQGVLPESIDTKFVRKTRKRARNLMKQQQCMNK